LAYREKLIGYLEGHKGDLSEDSLARLQKNPLRIFDSKDHGDQAVMADAPLLGDHLNDHSNEFFTHVRDGLDALGIAYEINSRLVRGLDYYCHTAFEFVTDTLGAQGAVLAGGRYDGLMEQMGGRAMPGIGWAAGVERLSMMVGEAPAAPNLIVVIPLGDVAEREGLKVTQQLRHAGLVVEMGYSGNMKKRINRANKAGAGAVVIIGGDELTKGVATVRNMETGEQTEIALDALVDHLAAYR